MQVHSSSGAPEIRSESEVPKPTPASQPDVFEKQQGSWWKALKIAALTTGVAGVLSLVFGRKTEQSPQDDVPRFRDGTPVPKAMLSRRTPPMGDDGKADWGPGPSGSN